MILNSYHPYVAHWIIKFYYRLIVRLTPAATLIIYVGRRGKRGRKRKVIPVPKIVTIVVGICAVKFRLLFIHHYSDSHFLIPGYEKTIAGVQVSLSYFCYSKFYS
jgi:hypothetical protein